MHEHTHTYTHTRTYTDLHNEYMHSNYTFRAFIKFTTRHIRDVFVSSFA